MRPCGQWTVTRRCDAEPTRPYLVGDRCTSHTPAVMAGRAEVVPDPAMTLVALEAAAASARPPAVPSRKRRGRA